MTVYRQENSGFLRQSRHSPSAIAIVIALHGAAITAAFLVKSGAIPIQEMIPIDVINVEPDVIPPPIEPPTPPENPPATPMATDLVIEPLPLRPVQRVETAFNDLPQLPPAPPPPPPPEPEFLQAQIHPSGLQPPYPSRLLRQEVEGTCTVRVHVAANGRVDAAEAVRSTNPAFCEATTGHALRRWRFEPATRGGRPVDSWQQHTVVFQING
ncbi:energy transducer TonB [Parasphingopyxis marina]|uniref:Energy transducer TonB n=1 Tax=Parasphingopyxis marina TaxID=2761622 RepID=A0A842HWB1_9SPHN|nr:energy transducer TonB [Parasphingopyxis marina]MBC2776230.1 energy transducer TonB [Parasphingopyxis marina]